MTRTKRAPWQIPEGGLTEAELTRFWNKVHVEEGEDGHWLWTGALNNGYPSVMIRTLTVNANRVAWGLSMPGKVPGRLDKACPDARCVRPQHFTGKAVEGVAEVLITDAGAPKGGVVGVVTRTTWTCTNGRTCDHCGHVLTAHDQQRWCPAEKRWKCPCGEAFAQVGQFDEHRSTCNEPYPVKITERVDEEYIPPSATRTCSDCTKDFHEKENWSTEPGVDRCKHCEQVRMGLIKDHSKWCTCDDCVIKRDRERSGQGVIPAKPQPKTPAAAKIAELDDVHQAQHPGDGYRTLDAYASLQFGFKPNPRHTKLRAAAEEPVMTPEGSKVVPLAVGTVEYQPSPVERERFQSISVQEMADIIFAPSTVMVTYPSGAVHISHQGARVIAPDAEAALQYVLVTMGKRKFT